MTRRAVLFFIWWKLYTTIHSTADTFQYNYDEKNGRLVSQADHPMRYDYFYDNTGNVKRIALEFFNGNKF